MDRGNLKNLGTTQTKLVGFFLKREDFAYTASELAEAIGVSHSSIRKALHRLYQRGVLLRSQDPRRGEQVYRLTLKEMDTAVIDPISVSQ
jgi:predicted transcriptional regulator